MKKVGKYVIISLLLLLGLCCVGILYLFFIPNSTLFNITYINLNKKDKSLTYKVSDVDQVNMVSRSYDVNILSTEDETIYVEVFSNSFGFVHTSHKEANISSTLKNGVLSFEVDEPYGFATKNSSYINFYLPQSSTFNLNLENKNALTTIKSSEIAINNLTYSTTDGDFNFNQGTINGTLNLNLNKSTFTIGESVATNSNTVNLNLTKGKFYAEHSVLGNVTINQNERGVISINECADLREDIKSAGGQISVNKLSHINVKTSDTVITIDEVADGAIIDLTDAGSVKINKLLAYSTITTISGNIAISNCEADAILHTDTGNINVNNATKIVSIQTNYGDVNVTFSEDAEHYSESATEKYRTLYARIYNGKLTATGVEHIGVASTEDTLNIEGITVTGNGRVNLTMNDVIGDNAITGNNGNVKVVINHSSEYNLTTSSNSGNVRVNLMQISDYRGYTTKLTTNTAVNCSDSTNNLSVSTNQGDLTVLDTVMFENGF